MNNRQRLISITLQQVEIFLLDAQEFYPFGTYIDLNNEIIPVSIYFENEFPKSAELIGQLEKHFNRIDFVIGIIAIDIQLKKNGIIKNAVEVRVLEKGNPVVKKYFEYKIETDSVLFDEITIS